MTEVVGIIIIINITVVVFVLKIMMIIVNDKLVEQLTNMCILIVTSYIE